MDACSERKKVECMDINRKKKKKKRIWGKNLVYSDNLGGNRIGFEVVKVWCGQQLLSWLYVWALLKGYVHLYSLPLLGEQLWWAIWIGQEEVALESKIQ